MTLNMLFRGVEDASFCAWNRKRDNNDPSVIVFSEMKRCQHPHPTQIFQKAKKRREEVRHTRFYIQVVSDGNLVSRRRISVDIFRSVIDLIESIFKMSVPT